MREISEVKGQPKTTRSCSRSSRAARCADAQSRIIWKVCSNGWRSRETAMIWHAACLASCQPDEKSKKSKFYKIGNCWKSAAFISRAEKWTRTLKRFRGKIEAFRRLSELLRPTYESSGWHGSAPWRTPHVQSENANRHSHGPAYCFHRSEFRLNCNLSLYRTIILASAKDASAKNATSSEPK